MILTPAVLELFGRQHNVASVAQLRGLLSHGQMHRARISGILVDELPQVRRLAGSATTWPSRVMALSLFAGEHGFVSGFTAARVHGVQSAPRGVFEVTVSEARSVAVPAWVRLHRTSWRVVEDRLELETGEVVSTPLRTLFRCAVLSSDVRFEKIAEQMWHRGLISPFIASLYLGAIRRSGRGGVDRFARWLEKATERPRASQSGLEVELARAVVAAGLPEPCRQYQLRLRNGENIHLDIAWPAIRFGVEPGATFWHSGDEKLRSDRARDRGCDEIGWRVIRYDDVELHDLDRCVRQIVRIYQRRLQEFAA